MPDRMAMPELASNPSDLVMIDGRLRAAIFLKRYLLLISIVRDRNGNRVLDPVCGIFQRATCLVVLAHKLPERSLVEFGMDLEICVLILRLCFAPRTIICVSVSTPDLRP